MYTPSARPVPAKLQNFVKLVVHTFSPCETPPRWVRGAAIFASDKGETIRAIETEGGAGGGDSSPPRWPAKSAYWMSLWGFLSYNNYESQQKWKSVCVWVFVSVSNSPRAMLTQKALNWNNPPKPRWPPFGSVCVWVSFFTLLFANSIRDKNDFFIIYFI